ncbi:MAG TPA: hypothetical protein VGL23_17485 [Chloroflexota bacterium]
MAPQQAASSWGDLGLVAVVVAALLAAGAAIWVALRTQGVTGRIATELRQSQERLAREQQQHQAQLAREQQQFQERQAQREHEQQELLARTAHAAQMSLGRYSAARARRERRIDPLLEHVTRQTANATRILPAFENGRRSDAWRLLEAIMLEREAFDRVSPGLVNDPAILQGVLAYGQAETELRDAVASRIDALEEGVPTPLGEPIAAAYAELTLRASELETAVERYIAAV